MKEKFLYFRNYYEKKREREKIEKRCLIYGNLCCYYGFFEEMIRGVGLIELSRDKKTIVYYFLFFGGKEK